MFSSQVTFSRITKQQVLGQLKSVGSTDKDVLFAAKERILETVKPLKLIGMWAYITGGLMTAMILMAFLGIPLLIFGWWVRKRGRQNIETVETTYAEYIKSVGSSRMVAV
jgi:hypothetical protein